MIEGEDDLRRWLQELMDSTIAELDGTHFDIPEPVKRVEAMIAPPGGAAAMYYTGPSEDFSRPGRTWYPTLGKTRFPLWGEVSIAYHEGVPGHHLQIGQVRYLRDRLSRFQRTSGVSGHAEGWALYAERLMDELGYLDRAGVPTRVPAGPGDARRARDRRHRHAPRARDPDRSGRSTRASGGHPTLGQEFVDERSRFPLDFMASEIVRYLGWPGQAISYKVGERAWLAGRADAEAPPRRGVRPEGVPRLRARPRTAGPRPPGRRARPLLTVIGIPSFRLTLRVPGTRSARFGGMWGQLVATVVRSRTAERRRG